MRVAGKWMLTEKRLAGWRSNAILMFQDVMTTDPIIAPAPLHLAETMTLGKTYNVEVTFTESEEDE